MSTTNLAETPESSPIRLNNVFKLRCKTAAPHTNPEGKRSIKFEFEIAEPVMVVQDGEERDVTSINLRQYMSIEEGKLGRLASLHRACGLPLDIEWNEENNMPTNVDYVGAECWAYLTSKQDTRKDSGGQPLINPNTGEALVSYQHEIREFLKR